MMVWAAWNHVFLMVILLRGVKPGWAGSGVGKISNLNTEGETMFLLMILIFKVKKEDRLSQSDCVFTGMGRVTSG